MELFGFDLPLGVEQFAEPRIVLFSILLAAAVAAVVWQKVLRPQPAPRLFFRWTDGPNKDQADLEGLEDHPDHPELAQM